MVVGSFTQETDLVIIGGGPGGYTTAFRAAELGVATTIVDTRDVLGGVCLHEGCIPSKTLLYAVQCIRQAKSASTLGITFGEPTIDIDQLRSGVQQTIDQLAKGLGSLCKKHKVEMVQGSGHFDDSRNVTVTHGNTTRLRFRRAVIATGSRAKEHAALPFSMPQVWSPHAAMKLERVPKTMLVVGDNYTAVEIAGIYAGLGSTVTLVTEGERFLPTADEDLIRPLLRMLNIELQELCAGVTIADAQSANGQVKISFAGDKTPKNNAFEVVVCAIGQQGNIESLQLPKTSVKTNEQGFITVDDQMRTTDPRIFAVGDVTGALQADLAIAQGRICAEVAAGWDSVFDAQVVPTVVFTDPNVAWCGLTETAAKRDGIEVSVKKIPWGASGRAAGMRRTEGMTKLICDNHSELVLGVGIVGLNAAEMIGEAALAIEMGATVTDLAATIHPHPTTCELISDAGKIQ